MPYSDVIDGTNILRVVCTVVLLLQKNTLDWRRKGKIGQRISTVQISCRLVSWLSFDPFFTFLHGFNRSGFGNLCIPFLILSVIDSTIFLRVVCTVVLSLQKNTLDWRRKGKIGQRISTVHGINIVPVGWLVALLMQINTLDADIFVYFEPFFTFLHGFMRSGFGNFLILL